MTILLLSVLRNFNLDFSQQHFRTLMVHFFEYHGLDFYEVWLIRLLIISSTSRKFENGIPGPRFGREDVCLEDTSSCGCQRGLRN